MGIIGWLVIGALAGWIGSKITGNNARMGIFANIIVGIIGAFIGGFLMGFIGSHGVTGFNLWSLFVAVIGATVLLWLINLIRGKR